ncbi:MULTISPECIES: hypothetical protein [Psychrobacillus]|uniref:Permease n=1 Tax=Psychrobacillus faecigallinarum TaxID=2762235 RepID=A0ABR8R916_9BACI|nr:MULTISPECIES: hypothetical protein [Psychrobacillus]MBD7944306.1 hypothetical protein [Psychrobacillus faecigallinarum]QEY19774.1 hypothetical protein D0S48_03190 [Psychrobacillus sp. AK 1817]QGM30313.1 hypothetical protein GI482_07960 [Bacillus sp. N3536]
MLKNYGKIAGFIIVASLFLLILGVRYVLGQDLVVMNFIAFAAFSIVTGVIAGAMLFYNLHKAFYLFTFGLAIGFIDLFRSFIINTGGNGDLLGILSLFIFTAFGLVLGMIVEAIFYLIKKTNNQ